MNRRDFLRVTGLAGVAAALGVQESAPTVVDEVVEMDASEWLELVNRKLVSKQTMMEELGIESIPMDDWPNHKYAWLEDTLTPRADADYSDGYTIIYEPDNT